MRAQKISVGRNVSRRRARMKLFYLFYDVVFLHFVENRLIYQISWDIESDQNTNSHNIAKMATSQWKILIETQKLSSIKVKEMLQKLLAQNGFYENWNLQIVSLTNCISPRTVQPKKISL